MKLKAFQTMKNKVLIMVFFQLLASGVISAQSGELMNRKDIDPKYTWNLTDIYENEENWQKDFDWLKANYSKYSEYEGKLGESSKNLYELLKFDATIGLKVGKVYLYTSLAKDLDLADQKYQGMYEKTLNLYNQISASASYIVPEILSLGSERIELYLNQIAELKVYRKYFDDIARTKEHTLTKEMEELLAQTSQITQTAYDAFSLLKNADMEFPTVEGEDGNPMQISDGRYYAALYSNDRAYRERVYKGYYKPFMQLKNTYKALFNGNLKNNTFYAKARKYKSNREAALDNNNIPVSVYDNLVETAAANTQPIHRWVSLKKKVLKLEDFHPYDTYVTLFPAETKEYKYDDAVQTVLSALTPLGDEYIKALKTAFDNRWIDVYETKGKRSGAYSSGTTFGVHPYVLLNWNYQMNDMFTLAHEMGHNMHSYFTGENQPYPYANYSIFVAEVASITNEALLLDYMIENAKSKEEKMALIEHQINSILFTFYRQTRFADFEHVVNSKVEQGEALTSDKLCEIYGEMYQNYWGSEMVIDEEETYTWARIPHFYYNFYVYQYATSYAAAQALAAKIKEEGQPAIDKYLKFLKSGSSVYPIDLLNQTGVDMNSTEPVMAVVSKLNSLIDQLEKLINE